uniref:RNA uridylyltransferase n=1 Tax=Plectus sambesii TaxID=2011161 RepID=A0A914XR29_9BILA
MSHRASDLRFRQGERRGRRYSTTETDAPPSRPSRRQYSIRRAHRDARVSSLSVGCTAEQSNGAAVRQITRLKQPKKLTMEELEAEGIHMLKEKSARFPDAIAYCRMCEYHVHCFEQHLKHPDHKKAKTERRRVERLGLLPDPTPMHSAALTVLVERVAKVDGRPVEHLLAISNFAEMLSATLQRVINPARIPALSLPVLHEMHKSETEQQSGDEAVCPYESDCSVISRTFSGTSDWNVGEIWWRFFKYYTVMRGSQENIVQIRRKAPVDRDEKNWTKKRIAIEDPFLPAKNLAQFSQAMYDYFASCFQTTFSYFIIPRTRAGAVFQFDLGNPPPTPPKKSPVTTRKRRRLKDRSAELKAKENQSELSDVQSSDPPPQEHSPPTAPSPTGQSESLTSSSPTARSSSPCEYTSTFMRQLAKAPLASSSLPHEVEAKCVRANILSSGRCEDRAYKTDRCKPTAHSLATSVAHIDKKARENASVGNKDVGTQEEDESDEDYEQKGADVIELSDDEDDDDDEGDEEEEEATDEQPSDSVDLSADSPSPIDHQLVDVDALGEKLAAMAIADFHYDFSECYFCGDMIVEVTCLYCTVVGHKEVDCPEKKLPENIPLSPMSQEFHDDVNAMLDCLHYANKITKYQINFMEQLRQTLQAKLDAHLFPGNCRLDLFGSARNGFGFCFSDIDLCLRFNDDQLPSHIDPRVIIQECANLLSADREFFEVVPITTAKVPIVKFKHFWQTVEGDISLYNVLALRNTELLRTYAMMDERVQKLGIVVKSWAKHCDIGDASKGSLSSYSLIIMLIHYLQRCDPPVVPVLQEMGNEDGSKSVMVDGWNTYFFSDLKVLRLWSRNRQTVAQLWLGFLCYYAEQKFNPALDVVQIRQTKPLSKFEKLWTGKSLAIEDPFDLNHNLAAGLGKRMFSYIWRCLIRSRVVFGNADVHQKFLRYSQAPSVKESSMEADFVRLMLDEARLKEDPPRDRVCRICGTVGHFAESCPRNRRNRAAAKRQQEVQQYQNHYQQRYARDRQLSTSSSDPPKRPVLRSSVSASYDVESYGRPVTSRDNRSAQLANLSLSEERRVTTEEKANRKERRQRKEDARKMLHEVHQSSTPSSGGDGIDEEVMAAALGVGFVNSIEALSALGQPVPSRMPFVHNRGRGGGHAPVVISSHPRGFHHRAPQPLHLQQQSARQQLSGAGGSSKRSPAVRAAQSSSAAVPRADGDVPAVISAPPGAAKAKSRTWKQSSPSKRPSPADSTASPSAAVRRQRRHLANGPPGWNAGQVMQQGLGRGQVANIWKDE